MARWPIDYKPNILYMAANDDGVFFGVTSKQPSNDIPWK